jgi:hypothetical protein
LSVIILNWRRPDSTLAALEAVMASDYSPLHVLVVDNDADPRLAQQLPGRFPQVKLIQTKRNLGYAAGNNIGLHCALAQGTAYALLLNDDAFVAPDAFSRLVSNAQADPKIAAVGPKILVDEDPRTVWAAGPAFPRRQPLPPDDSRFDQPTDCDYVVGCCILLRGAALEKIGLLDPAFFAIHEEWEWCYRARRHGYRICYEPTAIVRHRLERSLTAGHSPLYHYLYLRNLLRAQQLQNGPRRRRLGLQDALRFWRHEVQFIRSRGGGRRRIWAATRGMCDFLRGRYGPPPSHLT